MNTIALSVADRLLLRNLLPERGAFIEMVVIKDFLGKIGFTPEEVTAFELEDQPGNVVKFNAAKSTDIIINLEPAALSMLKAIPEKVDSKQEVTVVMIPLLQKLQAL
jgi:hypothetical protein